MSESNGDVTPQQESIPDFIQLSQIPVNYTQQVETDLLEPVVFSDGSATTDGFIRFTLQNKGFLHSHSKIFISVEPANASVGDAYFSPHLGVAQVLKKAVLKIGNKQLNELDSIGGLMSVKSSLITNENNVERELYTTGRYLNHAFDYNSESKTNASDYSLDAGVEKIVATNNDVLLPDCVVMDGSAKTECPTFMIDLSDIFPFLKTNQIPLYMLSEPVNIELTLHPTTKFRAQISSGDTTEIAMNVSRAECKFCADYIFYNMANDTMERYAQANRDMSFSFVDYRLVEHTTSSSELGSGVIRNLGMANRLVPRIITTLADDTQNETSILGRYNSIAPTINASGVDDGLLRYNVRYNDRFEFTSDVDNTARLFSIFTDSEGVPFITRSEFNGQALKSITSVQDFQTRNQDTNLKGQMFNLGTRLTNGRVGQRGLELHITGTFPSAGRTPNLLRAYCEYLRVLRLTDGMVELYNA